MLQCMLGIIFALEQKNLYLYAMIKTMLIAGLGGFVGTCLRFLTGKLCHLLMVGAFPLGTFAVNIVGSFIIGLLFGAAERTQAITPAMSALLITGFCGGFTTFSSFADDIYLLLQNRHYLTLTLYAGGTIVLGVALVWVGRALMKG